MREREREYKESKEGKMFIATTESGRLGSIVSFARKLKELSISVCFIKLTKKKKKKKLKASNASSELVVALLLWIQLYI